MGVYHGGAGLLYGSLNAAVVIAAGPVVTGMVKNLYFSRTGILAHLDECCDKVGIGVACQFGSAVPTDIGFDYYLVAFLDEALNAAQLLHCGCQHISGLAVHDCCQVCIV